MRLSKRTDRRRKSGLLRNESREIWTHSRKPCRVKAREPPRLRRVIAAVISTGVISAMKITLPEAGRQAE